MEQNLNMQLDALQKEGCSKIFKDKVSGVKAGKPNLEKLMEYTRPGDTIVVWKLDGSGHPAVGKKYHSTH
ncbi:hypothetical protein GCM10027291_00500 [Telluribacter humicola]